MSVAVLSWAGAWMHNFFPFHGFSLLFALRAKLASMELASVNQLAARCRERAVGKLQKRSEALRAERASELRAGAG